MSAGSLIKDPLKHNRMKASNIHFVKKIMKRNPIVKTGKDGTLSWTLDGVIHREDGPAVIYTDGTQIWYKHGHFHREDGPTFTYPDGYQSWYVNNQRHRLDGPAVINEDGSLEFWAFGVEYKSFDELIVKVVMSL